MIIEITRSYIRIRIGDRTVTLEGEAYMRGHGSPDFVVYENAIHHWDPPNDNIGIDENTKKEILEILKKEMAERNMTLEVE